MDHCHYLGLTKYQHLETAVTHDCIGTQDRDYG